MQNLTTSSEIGEQSLSFKNINYTLNISTNLSDKLIFWKKTNPKKILHNVSGILKPGMNAIMGNYLRLTLFLNRNL